MSIKLLDDATISKIAAGEIIENPASIIKELLENSIDANAKNIVIEIKGSIGEYIRITDDGDGIDESDLDIAFLRHSTSKLRKVEDLYNIVSLGFRGEALASISHISHVEVMTKTKDSKVGTRAVVENGKIISKNNIGLPIGTTFYIKDVFYNTPVRKKYLKNDTTEFNYINEVVQKIALGNNNVSIKLIRDGKIVLNSNRDVELKNHIYSILGRDIAANLIENNFNSESYKIKAFFSNNKLYRSNRNHQYIYINGRYVKNLDISRKLEKEYYSLIPLNRYPVFLLYIEIDPILVDVNIHPKKHEVKLSKENNLIAILCEMIEDSIYPNRSIEKPIEEIDSKNKKNVTVFEMFTEKDTDEPIIEENFLLNDFNSKKSYDFSNIDSKDSIELIKESDEFFQDNLKETTSSYEAEDDIINNNIVTDDNKIIPANEDSKIDKSLLETTIIGTLFKTFIVLENSKSEKCYLIDQHAAHERIMYEKFKYQYENTKIDKQMLLTPEIINVNAEEKNKIENNIELFNSLGFEIEEFGENSILIRTVPMIFGTPSNISFIYDSINMLDRDIKSTYEIDPYKIMRKACKAAVKAGDVLSNSEIYALIESLIDCDNPYTCPHGRPTIIEFSKYDIEKAFLREGM
ncbi:DNA mismatch repair endonuclease MutL [Peptoniphilus stercorisuis]|uniref:DNA mismatch repair protein MutL n=1 Tax=Peptoniphilus stercorisuis TaxID=1436965 RepID=A0ABS4KCL5_9FIRM|nr:DNA mismatch repair endonuclease MutL [Peptoniphilus stercorisuis]MBP2025526.1 DNA mismatch repair protein MutL [Peptoniphilus stercorisuis]